MSMELRAPFCVLNKMGNSLCPVLQAFLNAVLG